MFLFIIWFIDFGWLGNYLLIIIKNKWHTNFKYWAHSLPKAKFDLNGFYQQRQKCLASAKALHSGKFVLIRSVFAQHPHIFSIFWCISGLSRLCLVDLETIHMFHFVYFVYIFLILEYLKTYHIVLKFSIILSWKFKKILEVGHIWDF